jgi:tetratricopeptide (TPR) repeat protein
LYQSLAAVLLRSGRNDQALIYLGEGLEIARGINNSEQIVFFLQNLGAVSIHLGQLGEAEARLQEALDLARPMDHQVEGTLLTGLGEIASIRGDYLKALTLYQQSLEIARQAGNRETVSAVYTNLGEVMVSLQDWPQAEAYLKQGFELAQAIENPLCLSGNYLEQGVYYLKRGKYYQAQSFFEKAITIAKESDIPDIMARAEFGLAQILMATEQTGEAIELARKCLIALRRMKHRRAKEVEEWVKGIKGIVTQPS